MGEREPRRTAPHGPDEPTANGPRTPSPGRGAAVPAAGPPERQQGERPADAARRALRAARNRPPVPGETPRARPADPAAPPGTAAGPPPRPPPPPHVGRKGLLPSPAVKGAALLYQEGVKASRCRAWRRGSPP